MTTTRTDGALETLSVSAKRSVMFADIAAPPMNLLGPELVRDLVALIEQAEADDAVKVAELAERYGWINRALPAHELGAFVASLAQRIAGFPPAALATIKDRVAAITLASTDDFRRDSDLFLDVAREPAAQTRTQAALERGFQTPEGELALAPMLDELADR